MEALRLRPAGDGDQTTIDRDRPCCPRLDRGAAAVWWQPAKQQQPRFGRGGGDDGPVPVIAALTKRADVPVYLDGVGTVRALNTVTVRSQVDGKLLSVNYTEGQEVESGYVLAQIDPTTYQAAYDQAVAKKAQDEATLANAQIDLERYTRLAATNSIAQAAARHAEVAGRAAGGAGKSDQAQIDNAQAILDYTNIVAPIAGRTGIRQVDEGNIVRASDATGIVVITQIKPISVLFNLPQQQLGEVNRAFAAGALPVDAFGARQRDRDRQRQAQGGRQPGRSDHRHDQAQGRISQSRFAALAGQFVNVRLLINTLRQVVVVPTAAVQRGPNGTFVYVVKPDSKVAVRPVTVTQQDEAQAVIAKGLEPASAS